jgi:hypothetical protein
MKNKFCYKEVLILMITTLFSFLTGITHLPGQDPAIKERARLSLEHITSNTKGNQLKATVKAKLDVSYVGIPDVKLAFYLNEISQENLLGSGITNESGIALISLPILKEEDKTKPILYWVSLENDPKFRDVTVDLQVRPASLEVKTLVKDSVRILSISVSSIDSTNASQPIVDLPVNVFVQRLFGLLPISEGFETTDEDGQLQIEFPQNIPGDLEGMVTVVTRVEENEIYGTILNETRVNWGVPLEVDPGKQKRQLWSSRANSPIYLIIIVNGVILVIWTIIADVVRQIWRIKRFEKEL